MTVIKMRGTEWVYDEETGFIMDRICYINGCNCCTCVEAEECEALEVLEEIENDRQN